MKTNKPLATGVILAAALTLAACGGGSGSAPGDLTFDLSDGSFAFDAVDGADVYSVGVSKELNDATGESLASINGSAQITKSDGSTAYIWSEQTGSAASIADTDGDGVVDGQVIFRAFSSSATTVGDILTTDQLPVGHYVVQAAAGSNDKVPDPQTAIQEFVVPGTLEAPEGFSARIGDAGTIEVVASGDYLLSALTVTGLPTKLVIEVQDGGSVVETLEIEDFSYTNEVLGPNKAYNFTHGTVTGTEALDASKEYTATVTAVGDGDEILDASAEVSFESATAALSIATPLEVTATSTAGPYDVAVALGQDASGADVYELTASLNEIVVARESGTFAADGAIQGGASLTFTTTASDLTTPVLDGKVLSLSASDDSLTLIGTGLELEGNAFELAEARGFGPR